MADQPDDKKAEALAEIAQQLERLPVRIATAMRKPQQGSGQRAYLDPDNLYRMLGFDPEKERERRRFREEIRHLRQTRRTAIAALIVSSLTAIGTAATAIIMALD